MIPSRALIVFDMDGVLVDVSRSYRETTRLAVRSFFNGAKGEPQLPDPLFSRQQLTAIKQAGGLNNDWDVTYQIIRLLCRRVIRRPSNASEKTPWQSYRRAMARWDVAPLARWLAETQYPLTRLAAEDNGCDTGDDQIPAFYRGDVGSGNIIKQIFQEIYLGPELFTQTYGFAPALYTGNGLNRQESLMIPSIQLAQLARKHILAIATGRPAAEAGYALSLFGLNPCFTLVLTLDDCLEAEARCQKTDGKKPSLSKPDPFMLDAIAGQIPDLPALRYYVGDMPDDMCAAVRSRAGFTGIGLTASVADKAGLAEKLRENGARHVFDTADGLVQFLSAAGEPASGQGAGTSATSNS